MEKPLAEFFYGETSNRISFNQLTYCNNQPLMPNRLIKETSPYLLQHAHNPVDWYPWGEEALARARAENKVILVSIGYSACHWCHVMERESFENEETASLMNDYFINIKIDREERPDLDHVYMDAVQMISGSGGWPLNCFLTPDAKPFYGGTYFPPVRAYNRSSWTEVISAINQAWIEKPEELVEQANNLTSHLKNSGLFNKLEKETSAIEADDLDAITENILKNADTAWGGFGRAPKFPQTFSIGFLLRQAWFTAGGNIKNCFSNTDPLLHAPAVKQALLSLDKMIMGGIYDQLGGGFARYSTDAQWLAPHFEKMLYDNALLIGVIAEAYQLTGRKIYRQALEQTMDFIAESWQDEDGGFFSAFDADSEGEEGKYYSWSKQEIEQIIKDPEAVAIFNAFYGVSEEGNWEGVNILWVQQSLEIFCKARLLDEARVASILSECSKLLLEERNKRVKPLLDDKKLMSWNAMMITACCKAWAATGEDDFLQRGIRTAAFIEKNLKGSPGVYHHNYKNGIASNPAFLDDLALYIEALCYLQECTGETDYTNKAVTICEAVLSDFFEPETGFFFYTPVSQNDIIFRKMEIYDGATPSGNSVMARNLFYLGLLLDRPLWKEQAVLLCSKMKKMVTSYATSFGNWAQIFQWVAYGVNEVAVTGPAHREISVEILQPFWPNKILQHHATKNDLYPLLAGRTPENNKTSIFLCYNYSCKQPVYQVSELFGLLNC
jgi:uncharacterized protein YyaL (SSP411 family)